MRLGQQGLAMLLAAVVAIMPAMAQARNTEKTKVTNQEVIDDVGRHLGISSDTLQAVNKSSPALLENLKDTVTAIKIVDLYSEARDTEALVEIYQWQKGKLLDKAAEHLLPQNMNMVIAAVKAYKASLEVIRDKVFIPSLEEAIYQRYKGARGGNLDYRTASPDEAYDQATASGKYFPAKEKMYDELVKSRKYNKELMGPKMEAAVWKQVDNFWKNRLEAKYAQEIAKRNRESLVNQIWKNSSRDLEKVRKAAAQIQNPKPSEKAKTPQKSHPSTDLKKLEGLFKGMLDGDKTPHATTPNRPAPVPAPAHPPQSGTANTHPKPPAPAANVKSGQVVQSCAVCAPAGMDCECGSTTCVCCTRGTWCWPK